MGDWYRALRKREECFFNSGVFLSSKARAPKTEINRVIYWFDRGREWDKKMDRIHAKISDRIQATYPIDLDEVYKAINSIRFIAELEGVLPNQAASSNLSFSPPI